MKKLLIILLLLLFASMPSAFEFERRAIECTAHAELFVLQVCVVSGDPRTAFGGPIRPGAAVVFDQVLIDRTVRPSSDYVLTFFESTYAAPADSTLIFHGFQTVSFLNSRFSGARRLAVNASFAAFVAQSQLTSADGGEITLAAPSLYLFDHSQLNAFKIELNSTGETLLVSSDSTITSRGVVKVNSLSHFGNLYLQDSLITTGSLYVDAPFSQVTLGRVQASNNVGILANSITLPNRNTLEVQNSFTALASEVTINSPATANLGIYINARNALTLSSAGGLYTVNGPVLLTGTRGAQLNGRAYASFSRASPPAQGIAIRFPAGTIEMGEGAVLQTILSPAPGPLSRDMAINVVAGGFRMQRSSRVASATAVTITAAYMSFADGTILASSIRAGDPAALPIKLITCSLSLLPERFRVYGERRDSLCGEPRVINVYGQLFNRGGQPYSTGSARVNEIKNIFTNEIVEDEAGRRVTGTFNSIMQGDGFFAFSLPSLFLSPGQYELKVKFSNAVTFTCDSPAACEEKIVIATVEQPHELALPVFEGGGDHAGEPPAIPRIPLDRMFRLPGGFRGV